MQRTRLVALGLAAVTTAAFAPVFGNGFIDFDDGPYVFENPLVRGGLSLAGIRGAATAIVEGHWHPLTILSHQLDVTLFGLAPAGHHATSLALHVANTLLLFALLLRLTRAEGPSALVAALFAVHPLHVQSVAWIAERKDVLSTLLLLLTLHAYVRHAERPSARRLALVTLLFALGLTAKAMLVTVPLVLLLLDAWPLARLDGTRARAWRLVLEKAPLFALAAAVSAITVLTQGKSGALAEYPISVRVTNAVLSCAAYLGRLVWPVDLAILYPHSGELAPIPRILAAGLLLLAITLVAVRVRGRHPSLLFGWTSYLVTLLPVSGLVQAGAQHMADRYTYVPYIGLFIGIVFTGADLLRPFAMPTASIRAGAAALVVLLAGVTFEQARYWKDSVTIFEHALAVTGENPIIENNLGTLLLREGRLEEALGHFEAAVRASPGFPAAALARASTLDRLGRTDEALAAFETSSARHPADAELRIAHGAALERRGRHAEAKDRFVEAAQLAPRSARAHYNVGNAFAREGRLEDAVAKYRTALEIDPDYFRAHHNLAAVLVKLGRPREAEGHVAAALAHEPGNTELRETLAWIRAQP